MARRFFILSGCSGGGKSTLLAELARRGYATVAEPGRRIVQEERAAGGDGLPWVNPVRFLSLCLARAIADCRAAEAAPGPVIFDRSAIDALAAMDRAGLSPPADFAAQAAALPYAPLTFLAPPWPELYAEDAERRHGLAAARAEYDDLARVFPARGHRTLVLPKTSVAHRAGLIAAAVRSDPASPFT
ncbi:AAA family ATPase [Acidimangrovimonas pyrenivorans]|uniref:AAA family ATPase n=1 Tax=Acidimangrovimonas pyrenivorans TaxID=2030798 RepID=A0ABV7AIT2_9RHOB